MHGGARPTIRSGLTWTDSRGARTAAGAKGKAAKFIALATAKSPVPSHHNLGFFSRPNFACLESATATILLPRLIPAHTTE